MEGAGGLVELVDGAAVGPGQRIGSGHDRREHAVDVERGGDGPADLAEGLQLPHRAGEVGGTGLQLGEQAHVLDGDHRLVGEGLEQGDLLVGEWVYLGTAELDHADRRIFTQ